MRTDDMPGLDSSLAKIEGDEIVIRIPLAAIPYAAELALSEEDYSTDDNAWTLIRITDVRVFAADMVRELNEEAEDGSTPVHRILDAAVCRAYDHGSEGASEGDVTASGSAQGTE